MGGNVNGPSLIGVPDWLPDPLGRYYLYFAHHHGDYIRLAYADRLQGPWRTYEPGTLQLEQTPCRHHIASPDVHIDHQNRQIVMYYHGPADPEKAVVGSRAAAEAPIVGGQRSFVATSKDGLRFSSRTEVLGSSYFRVFQWSMWTYALGMPGVLYRSPDGIGDFERGPTLFSEDMRHTALKLDGCTLSVFFSNAHDCPERILFSTVELTADWMAWQASDPITVLEPELGYEGAHLSLEPSARGWVPERVCQLRDPAIYREGDKSYLLYAVAGENGIAIAEIKD
jgi:hypothetical protein